MLKNREIIDILIGDTRISNGIDILGVETLTEMPYLTGPDLCNLSTSFGLIRDYCSKGNNKSRWEYLRDLIDYCIKKDKCKLLLIYLFDKKRFKEDLIKLSPENTKVSYDETIKKMLNKVNGILYFSDTELIKVNDNYIMKKTKTTKGNLDLYIPQIKQVNQEYIRSLADRAFQKVNHGSFDNAVTKSRTLLEEVFIYAIEKEGGEPPRNGKINQL